jgi:hypothetical protein
MNRRWQALLALPLAATLLLAACGGDDDPPAGPNGSNDSPAATATKPTEGTTGSPAANTTPTRAADSGGDDLPADLQRLASHMEKAKYTATYRMVAQGVESEFTIAQDPPKFYMAGNLGGSELVIIDDGKDTITCFKAGATGMCSKAGTGGQGLFDLRDLASDVDVKSEYKKVDSRRVAGFDSQCWEVGVKDAGRSTICFAKNEGVMTSMETTGMTMELTDYRKDFDAKLLEPPFPVQ